MKIKCKSCPLALICLTNDRPGRATFEYFRCEECGNMILNFGGEKAKEVVVHGKYPICIRIQRDFFTYCDACVINLRRHLSK